MQQPGHLALTLGLALAILVGCSGGGGAPTNPDGDGVPEHIGPDTTVVYAVHDGQALPADIYYPRGNPAHGMVLFFHSGGWIGNNRLTTGPYARLLRDSGFVFVSIDYRLIDNNPDFPGGTFPANFQDCRSALKWCQDHALDFQVPPNHVAVMGTSAGSHLAALVATAPPDPRWDDDPTHAPKAAAAVCLFGTYDFRPPFEGYDVTHTVDRMIGTPANEAAASPANWIDPTDPPICIMHGLQDENPITPPIQAQSFFDKLQAAGVPSELHWINHAGHGFADMGAPSDPNAVERGNIILAFLHKFI